MTMRSQLKALSQTAWLMRKHTTPWQDLLIIVLLLVAPPALLLYFSPFAALHAFIVEIPIIALILWSVLIHGLTMQWCHQGGQLVPGFGTALHAAFALPLLIFCTLCAACCVALFALHPPVHWSSIKLALLAGFGGYGLIITSIALTYRFRRTIALTYLAIMFGLFPWLAHRALRPEFADIVNALIDWAPVTCLVIGACCLACGKWLMFPLRVNRPRRTHTSQRGLIDLQRLANRLVARGAGVSMGRMTPAQTRDGLRPIILALAPAMRNRYAIGTTIMILALPHWTYLLIHVCSGGAISTRTPLVAFWVLAFSVAWISLATRTVWLHSKLSESQAERKLILLTPGTPPAKALDASIRRYFLKQYAVIGTILFTLQTCYFACTPSPARSVQVVLAFTAGALLGPASIFYSCHAKRIVQSKKNLAGNYAMPPGGWNILAVMALYAALSVAYDVTPAVQLTIGVVFGIAACFPAYWLAQRSLKAPIAPRSN